MRWLLPPFDTCPHLSIFVPSFFLFLICLLFRCFFHSSTSIVTLTSMKCNVIWVSIGVAFEVFGRFPRKDRMVTWLVKVKILSWSGVDYTNEIRSIRSIRLVLYKVMNEYLNFWRESCWYLIFKCISNMIDFEQDMRKKKSGVNCRFVMHLWF